MDELNLVKVRRTRLQLRELGRIKRRHFKGLTKAVDMKQILIKKQNKMITQTIKNSKLNKEYEVEYFTSWADLNEHLNNCADDARERREYEMFLQELDDECEYLQDCMYMRMMGYDID